MKMQSFPWEESALCARLVREGRADPEDWFPRTKSGSTKAVRICKKCPVSSQCLLYALSSGVYGVWGGKYIGSNRLKSGNRDIEGRLLSHRLNPGQRNDRDNRGRYLPHKG